MNSLRLCLLAVLLVPAQAFAQAARVWEAPLVIPTYELGAPDPNPVFPAMQGAKRRPIYPYPMLDSLTNRRIEKSYKAVYLENEYLRVTVLPELGGHLCAIFDKTTNRDVLYTNHVIKYGIVAIRGAWVSGGIEWNFPDGHTVTTVSPIDYATRVEPDGSATVTVGDTERIQRMQWAITIRLRPGWKLVETEVRLYNRRDVPGRYWFWATAAAPAKDDLRFAYPMREAYPHAFWPVYSFPIEKGVDVGAYRDVKDALSLFARNSKRDFMGVYYEKSDWGVVHVADHRDVPGKKTWTWGTGDAGRIWIDKLTDNDGQYVEFQAGRFETQMEHQFLEPHRLEHFLESWYPVDRLGGPFVEANRNAALRLTRQGGQARVALNVNSRFDDAELILEAGGKQLHSRTVQLAPNAPFTAVFDLPSGAESRDAQPLVVRLKSKQGTELLRYSTDTPIDGNPEFKPATRPVPDPPVATSAEQAYVEGLAADKKSDEKTARAAYQQALKRDPGFAPALTALGLSFYRGGEYEKAAEHLQAALRRNPDAGEAHYYLGLTRRAEGRHMEAGDHLLWCARSGYRESAARYVLGEMALAAGKTQEAIGQLSQSARLNPGALKAQTVLAMAERIAGRLAEAQAHIDAVVTEMPIDYLALCEQQTIYKARGKQAEAERAAAELWRLLGREPDSVLELAFDYAAAGRMVDARDVLAEAIRRAGDRAYPMLHYALGYFTEGQEAARQFELGAKGNPAFVFPHRIEEIAVLRAARERNPKGGRAAYYLGNALAANYRAEEALIAWRDAARLDPSNAVAQRNLAKALWTLGGDKSEALAAYERAIAAAPDDFHLYLEADQLLAAMSGATERRIKLLAAAPAAARSRPALAQALASAYFDAGRFEDAARLLAETQFTSGEGDSGVLALYHRAHLALARQYQQAGQHEKAAAEFLAATEYPRNLGVGRPAGKSHAGEYVSAARELEAAGKRAEAEALWRQAAAEPLPPPKAPAGAWSEQHYHQALALHHVGQKEEARALLRRWLGADPSNEQAKKGLHELK